MCSQNVIIRPAPEDAGRTTPEQTGHDSNHNTKLANSRYFHGNPCRIALTEPPPLSSCYKKSSDHCQPLCIWINAFAWIVLNKHRSAGLDECASNCSILVLVRLQCQHSVESPSMVDPQWDIWYWGSKRNLHTVCWSAVACEWGTTSVYFGITYVCFIPSRLHVFAVEPQYLLQDFLFLSKVSFEGHTQNLQKISCWFQIWMGFVGPILIKLWTSSIWGFL